MKVGSERTISKGPKPCWEFKDTTRQETRAVRRGTRGGRVEEEGMVEEEKSARWRTCAGLYNSRHKGHGSTQNPHPPWQICCTSLLSLISVRYGPVQIRQAVLVRQSLLQQSTLKSVAVDPVDH